MKHPQRYEYASERLSSIYGIAGTLNAWARDGWRVIELAVEGGAGGYSPTWVVLLERPWLDPELLKLSPPGLYRDGAAADAREGK
jgi:hypothetical protein